MISRGKKKTLVFAHDAGGAEVVAAYLARRKRKMRFSAYVAGPAARVFRRWRVPFKKAPTTRERIAKIIARGGSIIRVLTGTGWMTRIELMAIEEAKRRRIPTAAYLDSWVNYRERFGYPKRGWQNHVPDELWVGDTAAFGLAKKYFPHTPIRHVPNQYFKNITTRYRMHSFKRTKKKVILIMRAASRIAETLQTGVLKKMDRANMHCTVRVRLHPADERARFEKICARWQGVETEKSHDIDIVNDIRRARLVIGPETVALVSALLLKIPTVRIVPRGEKAFLPFKEIRKVASVKQVLGAVRKAVRH